MSSLKVWVDGELREQEAARANILSHGLHYGTGVFEGIRCYPAKQGRRVFRLRDHLVRMQKGGDKIQLPVDVEQLTRGTFDALDANGLTAAYIRPIAYFEAGGLGLDVAPLVPRSVVAAMPWKSHLGDGASVGVRMRTSSYRRNPATAMPPLKLCGGYVNAIMAKLEAVQAGYQEALFVDDQGFVVEATGENLFFVKNGRVIAARHADALPGITRATICTLTNAEERLVTAQERAEADEIFLTGTSAEVAPVSCFDGRDLPIGPITREIARQYQAVVHGETETQRGWLEG